MSPQDRPSTSGTDFRGTRDSEHPPAFREDRIPGGYRPVTPPLSPTEHREVRPVESRAVAGPLARVLRGVTAIAVVTAVALLALVAMEQWQGPLVLGAMAVGIQAALVVWVIRLL